MAPIRFCFALHLHQPVGNFDHVFEQHVRDVYRPLLEHLTARDWFPVAIHVSGPLLEWLETHEPQWLDSLGRLAADGKIEMLLAGFYEPVLAALPRLDRREQIGWLRDALRQRFGVEARGLWLTERVWEPDLAEDLHEAGVEFALVDDRHFLISGFTREQLHAPLHTEHGGHRLTLFPIDERLRYLIPFRPPEETTAYLHELHQRGHRLAVLGDDGEKFGGWPGTRAWVFDQGWLDRFISAIAAEMERGTVALSRFDQALRDVPSGGLAYLSTASYREMEAWSLPAPAALRLTALEQMLGAQRIQGPEGALVRGAHWRNFLVKYPESNRMHKKMLALSSLSRRVGDPEAARRAIGRAQCNDAYWHGVFGGLYLPFLRAAIWANLAAAEAILRDGEGIACERIDIDADGHDELWVHSDGCSVIVSPWRGGGIEELTRFARRENLADSLTRRREAYHILAHQATKAAEQQTTDGVPSIHELEHGLALAELPPVDLDDRAIFLERVLPAPVTAAQVERADYEPLVSLARSPMQHDVDVQARHVHIVLRTADGRCTKTLEIDRDGTVRASWQWDPAALEDGAWFTTELSLAREHELHDLDDAEVWRYPIETVSKSERGFERTTQGMAYLIRWPVHRGRGTVTIPASEHR
ncbi:MAG TPA: alpha-amylase/4-alpha-glucanotransferase domain-containing protein [Gemmatimonadaceae bacterium]